MPVRGRVARTKQCLAELAHTEQEGGARLKQVFHVVQFAVPAAIAGFVRSRADALPPVARSLNWHARIDYAKLRVQAVGSG